MLHARILTYLDEVARLGSIRKAASRLNVASSAINRQILALEQQLGAPIFERMPRRLRLTSIGELLIAHVRETLKSGQRVTAQIEALRGLTRGEVTIATMGGIAGGVLPAFVASMLTTHPRVHIRIKVLPLDLIPNAVLTGDADIALGYNFPVTPGLRIIASHDLYIGAVVAPDHPLTKRNPPYLADCLEYPIVLADTTMTIRPVVDRAFIHAGLPLYPTVETNSIEFMIKIVRSGRSITFLNPVDVAVNVQRGEVVYLPFQDMRGDPNTLKLAVRARGTLDAFPSVVAEELRQTLPRLHRQNDAK